MNDTVLIGRKHQMTETPREEGEGLLESKQHSIQKKLRFMSENHHRVRTYVNKELPKVGKPLSPQHVAYGLNMSLAEVDDIMEELDRYQIFFNRNEQGEVVWAFPMTVQETPHRISFSTGEQLYAA